jgi:hypothetical protein
MPDEARILFDRLLPESLEALLVRILARRIPRLGPDDGYRISSCGRFSGRIAPDLLAFCKNQRHGGAFVLLQDDVTRVLYLDDGFVVGAESNVLFERVGRVLLRAGLLDADTARRAVAFEEQRGTEAVLELLAPEQAHEGLERRVVEVGTALVFMSNAYFVFVDGKPALGALPRLAVAPMQLAIEGVRRYDEWRNAKASPAAPAAPATEAGAAPTPPADESPWSRGVDEIMRLLRERDD